MCAPPLLEWSIYYTNLSVSPHHYLNSLLHFPTYLCPPPLLEWSVYYTNISVSPHHYLNGLPIMHTFRLLFFRHSWCVYPDHCPPKGGCLSWIYACFISQSVQVWNKHKHILRNVCHVISHHLSRVMSHMSGHVLPVIPCLTFHVSPCLPCHVSPCIMSYHVSSVMFQHVLHFMSCLTCHHVSHLMSYLVCHISSCFMSCYVSLVLFQHVLHIMSCLTYHCDICSGRQIPGLRWLCSRKPKLKAVRWSEDIQDKDYQTQYKYSWSKSVLRLRKIDVYWIFSKYKYKWLLLHNCIKFKCISDQVKPDLNEYDQMNLKLSRIWPSITLLRGGRR